jgi:hypothetical protein
MLGWCNQTRMFGLGNGWIIAVNMDSGIYKIMVLPAPFLMTPQKLLWIKMKSILYFLT